MTDGISEQKITENKEWDFEAKQNLLGFLSVVLEVAKRNPELYKKILNENYEDNGNTNHTNKS